MKTILLTLIIITSLATFAAGIEFWDYLQYRLSADLFITFEGIWDQGTGIMFAIGLTLLVSLIFFYSRLNWKNDFLYLLSSVTFKKVSKKVSKDFNSTKEKMKKELEDEQ